MKKSYKPTKNFRPYQPPDSTTTSLTSITTGSLTLYKYHVLWYFLLMSGFKPRVPHGARKSDEILRLHGLPASVFEGKVVYDLGCGGSDLQADLHELGVSAEVTGFDINPIAQDMTEHTAHSGQFVISALDEVKAPDESADIVLATYSLPMWASSAVQIDKFYGECGRLPRIGGLLGVYPLAVTIQQVSNDVAGDAEFESRVLAMRMGAHDILTSPNWLAMGSDSEGLLVQRLA
jgi:SAM-dependent methyltransferase